MTEQSAPVNPLCTVIPVNQNSKILQLKQRRRRQPNLLENLYKKMRQYETVNQWFIQLAKKTEENKVPYATKKAAIYALDSYCKFTNMNPDQIISDLQEYMKKEASLKKHNRLIDKFWLNYPTKTTAHLYFTMIKSFYKANDYALTTSPPKRPTRREGTFDLTSNHIQQICGLAPIEHSSWILTNNYLALRIGALNQLTVKNFLTQNWDKNLPLYPVIVPKRLTGYYELTTYIGKDAMQLLKIYFEEYNYKNDAMPWAWSTETTKNSMLKRYAYEAGIINAPQGLEITGAPKGLCLIHTQIFRSRKQTIAERHRINSNWIDYMLGHIPKGTDAKHYSKPNDEDMYKCNLEILPDLKIFD